jgi:hypothetical protein
MSTNYVLRSEVTNASEVRACGSWDGFATRIRMKKVDDSDIWELPLTVAPGKHNYFLVVNGQRGNDLEFFVEEQGGVEPMQMDLDRVTTRNVPVTHPGALRLSNPKGLCYLNSALQILDSLGLNWKKAESPVGRKIGEFMANRNGQMELVNYLSKENDMNLFEAGDIRDFFLHNFNSTTDSKLWEPFQMQLNVLENCYTCKATSVRTVRPGYWFLLKSTKEKLIEKYAEFCLESCTPILPCNCSSQDTPLPVAITYLASTPTYLMFLTDTPVTLPSFIQPPILGFERVIYKLHAFSLNDGYHCRAVRQMECGWALCDDSKVSELPSIDSYTSTPGQHHLISVYKLQDKEEELQAPEAELSYAYLVLPIVGFIGFLWLNRNRVFRQ